MNTNKHRYNLLELLQFLSIDTVLGTVAIGYMAIRILNVEPNPIWWLILPMTVWVVYSVDHLIDANKKKNDAIIERHYFHYQFKFPIAIMVMIVGITALILSLLYLDFGIVKLGILLCVIISIYFTLLSTIKYSNIVLLQKELIIAFTYTTGIFLAPLYWNGSLPSHPILIIIINIFLLAWAEGVIISWFDFENDIKDGHNSFTIIVGRRRTRQVLILVHMLIEISIIYVLISSTLSTVILFTFFILLLINFILGLTILFPFSSLSTKYHRIIGESVFILPALLVFI